MKSILKLGLFYLLILAVSFSGEREDPIINSSNSVIEQESNGLKVTTKSFDDFSQLQSLTQQVLSNRKTNSAVSKDKDYSQLYDFVIDSTTIVEAKFEENYWYTMAVHRESELPGISENLVIVKKDGSDPKAYLYKYYPDIAYYQALEFDQNAPFSGLVKHIPINYGELFNETATVVCTTVTYSVCGNNGQPSGSECSTNSDGGAHVYEVSKTSCWAFDDYNDDTIIDAGPSNGGGGFNQNGDTDETVHNGDDVLDADIITKPTFSFDDLTEAQLIAIELGFTPISIEAGWIDKNLEFVKYLIDYLENDPNTLNPKREAALTVATEASGVKWEKNSGEFNNIESLKYTHTRDILVNGVLLKQFWLEDSDVISVGLYSLCSLCNESEEKTYYYSRANALWYEYKIPPPNHPNTNLDYLIDGFWDVIKTGGRFITPLEDVKILFEGTDFDDELQNRYEAAGFLVVELIPGGKLVRPITKVVKGTRVWRVVSKAGIQIAEATYTKFDGIVKSGVIDDIDDFYRSGEVSVDVFEDTSEVVRDVYDNGGAFIKPQLNWEQIKALFKRGNDFNKKGRLEYNYNEINLLDGKRLDSYIPGEQIISRKATTLSKIKKATFEGYLKELTTKYKKGKQIRSNKYKTGSGAIDGKLLSGDYYLEIPSTNKTFFENSTEFKNLANQYDVKIKYLDE